MSPARLAMGLVCLSLLLHPVYNPLLPATAHAASERGALRRFALLAAANDGGASRVKLRYAVTDAQNLSAVLQELGGIAPSDVVLLEEVDRAALTRGLESLRQRLQAARDGGSRTEAIIYYSGHSDEEGLLLRGEHFPFRELRRQVEGLPADVRVAILDSCASGAMARRKGGARRPAFMLDASTDVRGQAILTSSSADEASQESDRIGASYFTHHLVSGLRGAADVSRDGVVTLAEAYQFAFRETLARTEATQAGPQHPVYDIDLAGSGELVLTDLRGQRAGLAFAPDVEGRLWVRDEAERLVVEVRKARGEALEVGLSEGAYQILRQTDGGVARARVTVPRGARVTVQSDQFFAVAREATVSRGDGARQRWFLNLGLIPFVQTNDLSDRPVHNRVSFGLVAARSARVDGVAFGIAGHWTDGDARGLQLSGAFNGAGGDGVGLQLAGAANFGRGDFTGLQLGGAFNWAGGALTGMQLAGAVNHAHAGQGWQFAGAVNNAPSFRGLQLAGALNRAGVLLGAQVGVLNIGGEVTGAQVGVINVAGTVRGAQVGVINVGRDVQGESLGLFSFVGNGRAHVEVFASDMAAANVGVKLGSRHLHTVFTAGRLLARPGTEDRWTVGAGVGAHLPFGRWSVDPDLVLNSLHSDRWEGDGALVAQLRVLGGVKLVQRLTVFAGPTFNVAFQPGGHLPPEPSFLPGWTVGRAGLWPGFQVGLRY